jgi:hypothetical protein
LHFSDSHAIDIFAIDNPAEKEQQLMSLQNYQIVIFTPEQLRTKLAGADIPDICRATGLSYNTVKGLRDGAKGARYETLRLLTEYFGNKS